MIILREKDQAEKMLQELQRIRLEKIVGAEMSGLPLEVLNLTVEEKRLQVELRRLFASHAQSNRQMLLSRDTSRQVSSTIISLPTPIQQAEKNEFNLKSVSFLQPIPAIICADMKIYGPLMQGMLRPSPFQMRIT